MTVFEKIYDVVMKIPKGKVATYGQVALLAGNPRWARVVGYALHVNPEPGIIPCHRAFEYGGFLSCRHINRSDILFFQTKEMVELYRTIDLFVVYQFGVAWRIFIRTPFVRRNVFLCSSGTRAFSVASNLAL